MALIEFAGVTRQYRSEAGEFSALRSVDLQIERGEFVAVTGASGSGKSTLMNIMGCLDTPSSGVYRLADRDVARLTRICKSYGSRVVFDGLDFLVRRGERWCVMGANGAGKSTLLKLAAGEGAPDSGTVTLGAAVKLGYFAQHSMEVIDGDDTVWETLQSAFPNASIGSLRSLAGCFGFSGDEIEKRCRLLSGGEKARLVLARMLYDPPNFLVLDEPTNHLDLMTKEMLIRALGGFEGTMLLVSHDRHFLAALTNRVLELVPGDPRVYAGGYTEYVAASGHEAPGMRS